MVGSVNLIKAIVKNHRQWWNLSVCWSVSTPPFPDQLSCIAEFQASIKKEAAARKKHADSSELPQFTNCFANVNYLLTNNMQIITLFLSSQTL